VPPEAASVAEYAAPTEPLGREVVVMATAVVPAAMVSDRITVWVCAGDAESVTFRPIEALVAAAVGVPEITPVVADNDSPAGSAPLAADQV